MLIGFALTLCLGLQTRSDAPRLSWPDALGSGRRVRGDPFVDRLVQSISRPPQAIPFSSVDKTDS